MSTLALVLAASLAGPARGEEVAVPKVAKIPVVDGKANDEAWASAKELLAKLDQPGEENPKKTISIKAVHDGTHLAILLVWNDAEKNDQHAPFVLKGDAYEADEEKIEDACTVSFGLTGKFDSNMKAGIESTWDVWEWGAARTNAGFARDRVYAFSKTKPPAEIKARRFTDKDGGHIFFSRADDAGTPASKKNEAPAAKGAALVPQYEGQKPSGSAGDVEAKGEWAGGKWTVEFKRKLNTGAKDDAVITAGKSIEAAFATFDKAEKSDHDVTGVVTLKLQ
jgi:DMSO reductase family type II enzyme heme b subunit